jgi:hypothetical protein
VSVLNACCRLTLFVALVVLLAAVSHRAGLVFGGLAMPMFPASLAPGPR